MLVANELWLETKAMPGRNWENACTLPVSRGRKSLKTMAVENSSFGD
jgi:hypothetical protein